MSISLSLREFDEPLLEFGGPGLFADPREGLREGGPFDLRFGAARAEQINVGLVGPAEMVERARAWLGRVQGELPADSGAAKYPAFPGFEAVFRAKLAVDERWTVKIEDSELEAAFTEASPSTRFDKVLEAYGAGIKRLATLEARRPDVVLCCLSDDVVDKCRTVQRTLSKEQKKAADALKKRRESIQLDLLDMLPTDEQPEDLLFRDFRRALKARAMAARMPVQLATNELFLDERTTQGAATRAWNSCVGLYYKAGGIPWRLKLEGPETCFVGISFHHVKTTERHLVKSSIAQAFSSQGEGFALRGGDLDWSEEQGRTPHLTELQAEQLGKDILEEYRDRTGGVPPRVVLHKTSAYSEGERRGFLKALVDVPMIELINIMPTSFRLVRYGAYPPNRGTLCTVNSDKAYLFTTGFMPRLNTYPGPHIPTPVQVVAGTDVDLERASQDILGLARMNWNTAGITGGYPVTLYFARMVGGIMAEYGQMTEDRPLSSFRYYM